MGLYEEKRLFNRGDQPDDIFLTLIEYQNKEEISPEEKADFLKRMENVEQLCIGGDYYHYQHASVPFLELVFQLKNLKYLDMSYLRVNDSAIDVIDLSNLECFLAKNSGLTTLPDGFFCAKGLKYVDLSGSSIKRLPDNIGECINLEDIDLRGIEIKRLPDSFVRLTKLRYLDLSYTELEELPEDFFDCHKELEYISFRNTHINELSPQISKLKSLRKIGWGNSELTQLPFEQLKGVPTLEYLDISNTALNIIPNNLCEILPNLKGLDLERTSIGNSAITAISKLKKLEYLNLKWTKLDCIDAQINSLEELKYLDCSETSIDSIPTSISGMCKLQVLNLNYTRINRLPVDLCELSDLVVLELENTAVTKLPHDIGKLENLQKFNISDTMIKVLPDSMRSLKNLKQLFLIGMTINELPEFVLDYNLEFYSSYHGYPKDLQGIFIDALTLITQPVSLFEQPRDIIKSYFENEKETINTAKVILLGYGGAGKTYTLARILNNGKQEDYETNKTTGINIKSFYVNEKSITINFWDFGGQEIMYSMHRCFLTEKTCYVIVIDTRRSDMNLMSQARYWLRNVSTFGSGSSIIILVNLWDDDLFRGIDSERLHQEFDGKIDIVSIIPISVKNASKEKFNHDLADKIFDTANSLIGVGMQFPAKWSNIRTELQQLGLNGKKNYLSQDEYKTICKENGVTNNNEQIWLLNWFNDFGDCFSNTYGYTGFVHDFKVLSPRWITNAIYILINQGFRYVEPLVGEGLLSYSKIEDLLKEATGGTAEDIKGYSKEECKHIIELMRKFELSVKAFDKEGYEFIPALLPLVEPEQMRPFEYKQNIKYFLKYDYLPDSLLKRLMVRCFKERVAYMCWANGFTVKNALTQQTAVLSADYQYDVLRIEIFSEGDTASNIMLEYLLKIINELNSLLSLHSVQYIDIDLEGEKPVEVEYLLRLKRRGYKVYPGMYNDFCIDNLLGLVLGDVLISEENGITYEYRQEYLRDNNQQAGVSIINYSNCIVNNGNVINTEQSV